MHQFRDGQHQHCNIDINSTDTYGATPLCALTKGHLDASKLLVEKGANLFANRAIDVWACGGEGNIFLGPQVLEYAKNLKWQSVKPLLLLSKAVSISSFHRNVIVSLNEVSAQIHSANLATLVLANSDLVRYIASFLRRTDVITSDPDAPQIADAVRERIEAELAASLE